ncbi:sarcosine oxidase subunit gamma family protein [Rhizobium sp. CSW-27]|uniref:sarcosine oxidase subunit gamma n=1 Tax=Rhizobium sp. CSW-27 TaxID=2839985 RepID=UPI001C0273DA|nr:sarcosine oxidase subunit gamma family protein [Rhizobium sp. CSW-27]MBT9369449.1 sarcosine oxidase subunit gamma [Rhizobium sp. CSW-27]
MTLSFAHRHVLEDHIVGFETRPNPHHLAVVRRPTILCVLAHAGFEGGVKAALHALEGVCVRICGPAEWLVVSHSVGPEALLRLVREIEGVSAFDHSDGRVLMRIAGPNVRSILAKCLAVDLHRDSFAPGASANILIAHVAGNLARIGEDAFEIIVPRSYAGTVFEEVKEMGREFALTAGFSED